MLADVSKGDTWDHVAIDAESRVVVISVVVGKRAAENIVAVVDDFKRRTGERLMDLIAIDAIRPIRTRSSTTSTGKTITPPRTGKRGRPKAPYKIPPKGLTYAVVDKTREKGRVVAIATRVVFGTMAAGARPWECRRRAIDQARRPWSGRTGRTGTATSERPARRTDSAWTGDTTNW